MFHTPDKCYKYISCLYNYAFGKTTNKVAPEQIRIFVRSFLSYNKYSWYLSGVWNVYRYTPSNQSSPSSRAVTFCACSDFDYRRTDIWGGRILIPRGGGGGRRGGARGRGNHSTQPGGASSTLTCTPAHEAQDGAALGKDFPVHLQDGYLSKGKCWYGSGAKGSERHGR